MIKYCIAIFLYAMSSLGTAKEIGDLCLTNSQCVKKKELSRTCFIIETGADRAGKRTCFLQCYHLYSNRYCAKVNGKVFGICLKEEFPMPEFDPVKPNCQGAISEQMMIQILRS